MKQTRTRGFSLIELLMVLGVMGILMGMLIPSVGVVREKAQKMATGHKLRQVALAVATYQNMTGRALTAPSLADWMGRLATETGIGEGELFLFKEDPLVAAIGAPVPPMLMERDASGAWQPVDGFADWPVGIAVASGVSPLSNPSTTPVAWTRGLTLDGTWLDHGSPRAGVYGSEGGFIAFLDGHVAFYRDLREDGGQLVSQRDGRRTADIREAIGPGATAHDYVGRVF
jgi:prepilin-type N-terminal cleavage/methylation domain-containing protein/prepilin-type processing-associated H-X9-DG protein